MPRPRVPCGYSRGNTSSVRQIRLVGADCRSTKGGRMLDRRGFVSAVAALSAGAALAKESLADVSASDAWLDRLKGKHRQLFDVPDPDGGTVLRHVRNYLDVWRDAYGVRERDVSVIVVLYARTTPLGVQDAMWAKYKLGA